MCGRLTAGGVVGSILADRLRQRRQLPLIQAYEELAAQYPRGLAELAPLPVELSGEMQEAMSK